MKLSILIPMFNEEDTLENIVGRVFEIAYGIDLERLATEP